MARSSRSSRSSTGIRDDRRTTASPTRSCAGRRSRTRASSPCSTRSSTTCRRRRTCRRSRARCRTARPRPSASPEGRAVLGAGVQDRGAPVLRQAHLHPGLLGSGRCGLPGRQLDQGPQGAHREDLPDARQQGEPGRRGPGRSHLRGDRSEGHDHGRDALRPAGADRARVDDLPGRRSSRWRSSRRRRPTRRSWASRSSGSPRRTRPSRSPTTRRPGRRSSPAWASCTSRCSSTG